MVYPKFTLRLNVVRPDAEPELEPLTYTVGMFWKDFMELGAKVRAPQRPPTSRDMGVAARLLKHHDRERLLEMARLFWLKYSEPYFTSQRDVMVLFAAAIPEIGRDYA